MIVILISNIISKNTFQSIDKNFKSIYNDRLIPARDIFYVSENIHEKELIMDHYFSENESEEISLVQKRLTRINRNVDSLLRKYEKTFLVEEESKSLQNLKSNLKEYQTVEVSILRAEGISREGARQLYEQRGRVLLQETLTQLQHLTNIQSKVGNDIIKESQIKIANNSSLSSFEILIVILIGIFAHVLILSSKVMEQKNEKYHLN